MKKGLIFTFVLIFLLVSVSASESSLGTFKKGDNINLRQVCGTCSYNNITSLVAPSGNVLISNVEMNLNSGAEYLYEVTGANFTEVGEYFVNGFGDLNGVKTAWVYKFKVTESGISGISIEWVLVIILVLAYGLILFGLFTRVYPTITIGAIILLMLSLYIFVNGFGELGATSLLPQFFAAGNFVVGGYLCLKSLEVI